MVPAVFIVSGHQRLGFLPLSLSSFSAVQSGFEVGLILIPELTGTKMLSECARCSRLIDNLFRAS